MLYNKETIDEMEKIVPAPYIRLSDQMFNMDSETRSTAEREEFYVRAALVLPYPLRPMKQTEKAFQRAWMMMNQNSKSNFA